MAAHMPAMGTHRGLRQWIARLGSQRWGKEALLAMALTLAAAAFIAAAILGRDVSGAGKAPQATADSPQR
jgi:hypothetical protein